LSCLTVTLPRLGSDHGTFTQYVHVADNVTYKVIHHLEINIQLFFVRCFPHGAIMDSSIGSLALTDTVKS